MPGERAIPQQQRSRDTVNRILDAADALFGESGVHDTQMTEIIDRSGVRAGSLYRFFPDKMSIAAALVERHRNTINSFEGDLPPAETMDELLQLVDLTVDITNDIQMRYPGYRALTKVFTASDPESPLYEMRHKQVDLIVKLVAKVAAHLPVAERRRVVEYMAEILDVILNTEGLDDGRPARVAEAKRVLRAYAVAVLE